MTDAMNNAGGFKGAFLKARARVAGFFVNDYQLWWSFLAPFGLLLLAYLCFGVYPISNRSVLALDLNGQYVYYYDYIYDVLAGKESIFYSWSRNLSGEFMGIVGYYLASPFNLLVWIFPREHITEGLLTMMVTKVGAIGFCMGYYLTKKKKFGAVTTIAFSTLYALCSYTIVQTMNPMWLDGVMILPIVVYGIEELIDKGRFRTLLAALIYGFITCFYIGFMLAIFSCIYFIYYYVASDSREKGFVHFIKRGFMFGLSGITAALCSCFMLLPVYKSLSLGKFNFSVPDYSLKTNFNLVEILEKLFPGSYDTVRMEGLPFIYCGTIVLLMLPLYFLCRTISRRERVAGACIVAVMITCMFIRPVDMLWHGGQLPNWLPYRYSFMLTFLFVVFAAKAFEKRHEFTGRMIAIISFCWLAVLIYLENLDTFNATLGSGRDTFDSISVVLPAALVLIMITAVTVYCKDKLDKKKGVVVLFVFLGVELMLNTITGIVRQNIDIVYSTRDSYVNVIVPTREVVQEIKENDDSFYRTEKTYFRTVNDPMALNMFGLSHSSSTLNAKPIEMLHRLGFTSRSHYTRYSGATPLTTDLFGVKYILSCKDNDTKNIKSADDITVTVNEDAMPIAYMVNEDVMSTVLTTDDPFDNQNMLLSAMLGLDETLYFKRIYEVDLVTENVSQGTASGGHHYFKVVTAGKNAQLEYTIKTVADGELFMYLPTVYERQLNVWVNKQWNGNYFENDNFCIMSLGTFSKDEAVDLILTLTKDDLYFKEAQFAWIDTALLDDSIEELKTVNAQTVCERISPTEVHISVESQGDFNLLMTTIPAEEGWKLYVDGNESEYVEVLNALIGVPLQEGAHDIRLVFTTASYPLALVLTGAGIVAFALMILGWRYAQRRKARLAALTAAEDGYDEENPSETDEIVEAEPEAEDSEADVIDETEDVAGNALDKAIDDDIMESDTENETEDSDDTDS